MSEKVIVDIMSVSEPKDSCYEFTTSNFGDKAASHYFNSVESQCHEYGGYCKKHEMWCPNPLQAPGQRRVHITTFAAHCQSFSNFAGKRFVSGSVKQHSGTKYTFTDATALMDYTDSDFYVQEQVRGFLMPMYKGSTDTPLDEMDKEVEARRLDLTRRVFNMCASDLDQDITRPRIWGCFS